MVLAMASKRVKTQFKSPFQSGAAPRTSSTACDTEALMNKLKTLEDEIDTMRKELSLQNFLQEIDDNFGDKGFDTVKVLTLDWRGFNKPDCAAHAQLNESEIQYKGLHEDELKVHIDKLHEYNEIKDIAQMVLGRLANLEGVRTKDLYVRYGLNLED